MEGIMFRKMPSGEWRRCIDTGCDSFDKARASRQKVEDGDFIEAYLQIENWLEEHPRKKLPKDFNFGEVPKV